ncbi:PglL family O-oligosaccharyltransferase [Variovorax paradoxus]|uniref:PglL family O-oligosaccharyltransferase n=1 Tax=Variovorax paradoxus TaxID=34073 RepID=UPI0024810A97|nr:Wzy polymerase domain-containing protein [Variovorax paradoxus]WGT63794.1 Wzy polymerase domain-containing protein [Variovorax paradoxus]
MTSRAAPLEVAALPSTAVGAMRAGLIAFPFLCPLVAGPSVQAWQLFATWVCIAALLLVIPPAAPARGIWLWLAAGLAAVAISSHGAPALWLPVVAVLGAMAAAACVGTGIVRGGPPAAAVLATGILAAGLISAVLGLLQYYGLADPLVPWTTTPALGQAYGNLRQRNQFATLISMALVAALWIHATQPWTRVRRWLLPATLLLLTAAAASTSRTGLLQLLSIVGVATLIAWRERRGRPEATEHGGPRFTLPPPLVLLAMIPIYFAIAWALPQLTASEVEGMMQRLQEGAPGDHTRLILWRNVLTLIAEHPWTGWGWGELAFAHYSTLYSGPRFPEILDNAHNLPLHLAVELGIPASVLICGGFIWMVLAARPWRERDPARLMAWGMLGAIVLHSLLEYPLWYGPFQLVFGLCLGMLWPGRRAPARLASLRQHFGAKWLNANVLSVAAASVLAAVVGYATWDYIRISQIYLPRDERLPAYEDDTLTKAKGSWLFARQVGFAELTLTRVTAANAAEMHSLAERTIHFSPEPRVIVKLIESAELTGRDQEAWEQAERFRIAFPEEYERWLKGLPVDRRAP